MKKPTRQPSRPILNWFLTRGPHTLAIEVRPSRGRYQVRVRPCGERTSIHTKMCDAARSAFQAHAQLVKAFRDHGWMSIARTFRR
jgi:hypothetical protein